MADPNFKIVTRQDLNDLCPTIKPFTDDLNRCPTKAEIEEAQHFVVFVHDFNNIPADKLQKLLINKSEIATQSVLYFPAAKNNPEVDSLKFYFQGQSIEPYNYKYGRGGKDLDWGQLRQKLNNNIDTTLQYSDSEVNVVLYNQNTGREIGSSYKMYGNDFDNLVGSKDVIVDLQPVTMTANVKINKPIGEPKPIFESRLPSGNFPGQVLMMVSDVSYANISSSWYSPWRKWHYINFDQFPYIGSEEIHTNSASNNYQTNVLSKANGKYLIVSNPFTTYNRGSSIVSYLCKSMTFNGITKTLNPNDYIVEFPLDNSNNSPLLNRTVTLNCEHVIPTPTPTPGNVTFHFTAVSTADLSSMQDITVSISVFIDDVEMSNRIMFNHINLPSSEQIKGPITFPVGSSYYFKIRLASPNQNMNYDPYITINSKSPIMGYSLGNSQIRFVDVPKTVGTLPSDIYIKLHYEEY